MIPQEEMKRIKILIGQFHEEMKSNNVTDFVVWIDCKLELQRARDVEMQRK